MNLWCTGGSAVAAIFALVLSVITYVQVNSRAEIDVTLPNVIRVYREWAKNSPPIVRLDIGLTFSTDRKSDIPAFVTDASVQLSPPSGSAPIQMVYYGVVTPAVDDNTLRLTYSHDPAPIPVNADRAPNEILEFNALPDGAEPVFVQGKWNGQITIKKLGESSSIQNFCIQFSPSMISQLNNSITAKENRGQGYSLFIEDIRHAC